MAVTGTITITTVLFFYVPHRLQLLPTWVPHLFLAANLTKLAHGAWLPLLIGIAAFTVMTTWQRGRQLITARREALEGPLREFVHELSDPAKVNVVTGTAVFLNRASDTAPLALRANVEHQPCPPPKRRHRLGRGPHDPAGPGAGSPTSASGSVTPSPRTSHQR